MAFKDKETENEWRRNWRKEHPLTEEQLEKVREKNRRFFKTPEAKLKRKEHDALPEVRERNRTHMRQTWLALKVNGKRVRIRVNKRLRPDDCHCELCNRISDKLDYHHWDDTHPEFGLWLCSPCHKMAGGIEAGLHELYIVLKQLVMTKTI